MRGMRAVRCSMPANRLPARVPAAEPPARSSPPAGERGEAVVDDAGNGWYDSSFELKRGLWVIETDLDPAITHGIVVRKRTHSGGAR